MAFDGQTKLGASEGAGGRISNLDVVRGVAVLGILGMNAVSFGLGTAPYFNLNAGGSLRWWDWVVGGFGEVFLDQKFMGLFLMLFGAGIVLFYERAAAKGRAAGRLSLWRNGLLLSIGLAHSMLWDGDVLVVYALAAPVLISARYLQPSVLFASGTAAMLVSPAVALWAQATVGQGGAGLGEYWTGVGPTSDAVGIFLYADFFFRALGMMLFGIALYRTGVITGSKSSEYYRRLARWGIGVGLPLAAVGLIFVAVNGFSADVALVGSIPNTIGTIPAAIGYLALISLWNLRPKTWLHERLQAVGQMALTNYLSQTIIGMVLLRGLFEPDQLSRSGILVFVVVAWVIQLLWSRAWLRRFRYGPVEWLWRCATYRSWQPILRENKEPRDRTSTVSSEPVNR